MHIPNSFVATSGIDSLNSDGSVYIHPADCSTDSIRPSARHFAHCPTRWESLQPKMPSEAHAQATQCAVDRTGHYQPTPSGTLNKERDTHNTHFQGLQGFAKFSGA